ncbi:hypothetical protein MWR57_08065 [Desulfovibrionaceae bacterium CB1MN]|uniref:hypothetical protein n=1 Tax=Hydrosulfovibrio ferrireducens TaxID=2934181 RepID=UPI003ABB2451
MKPVLVAMEAISFPVVSEEIGAGSRVGRKECHISGNNPGKIAATSGKIPVLFPGHH